MGDLSADKMTWIATYREKLNLPEETGWSSKHCKPDMRNSKPLSTFGLQGLGFTV